LDRIESYNERRAHEKSVKDTRKKAMNKLMRLAKSKIKDEGVCRNPNCTTRKRPQWHHAVPRSKFGSKDERVHHVDNAIPLCHDCHMTWHQNVIVLRRSDLTASEVSFILEAAGEVFLDRHYPE
jgi:hypothetical protein